MSKLIFLLQANLYLVIFFAFYKIILEKETYFTFNRIYLITALLLSLGIPLIEFGWLKSDFISLNLRVDLPALVQAPETIVTNDISVEELIAYIYLAGVIISAFFLLKKLLSLRRNISHPVTGSAFSFFNIKIVDKDLTGYETIQVHEDTHIRQMHSLDILIFELACILAWFNPVIYLYKTSISTVHEFIADKTAAEHLGDKKEYALLLLNKVLKTRAYPLVNPFFKRSLIKKRIFMLQRESSGKAALLKYSLLLPSFLCFVVLSSATIKNDLHGTNLSPDSPAQFRGGQLKFAEYLSESLKYSDDAIQHDIRGKVLLSFVVDKDGSITDINVIENLGYGLDEIAVKVMKNSPPWTPAMLNGIPVKVGYTIPINFQRPD